MVLGFRGRRSLLFRVAARIVAAAVFFAPLRMSYAAATGAMASAGGAKSTKSVAAEGAGLGRAGKLATDTPWALAERIVPSRVRPLDGTADEAALARLFDDRAGSGLATGGRPVRFRIELAEPARLDAVGVFGRADGALSASVEGPAGRADVLGGADLGRRSEEGRWSRYELAAHAPAQGIVLEWHPASPEAVLPELELWGRPAPSAGGRAKEAARAPAPGAAPLPDALHTGVPQGAIEVRAPEAEQTISLAGAGARDPGVFTVKLDMAPRASSRAFLIYELSGLPHFTAARRSINGSAVRGGFAAVLGAKGGLQVEEIAPWWLHSGQNRIQFLPAHERDPAGYRVGVVRIVVVPAERGRPSDSTARDWAALRDGREATGWQVEPGREPQRREWRYASPVQPRALELRLPRAGSGRLVVSAAAAAPNASARPGATGPGADSGEVTVVLDDLVPGWHRVPLDKLPPSSRLAVSLVAGREKAVALSELDVTGSPIPADTAPRLAVTYPLSGECVGHRVHVRGFLDPPGPATLSVNGAPVKDAAALSPDGAFSIEMSDREAGAAPGKPFSVELGAAFGGGARVRRTVDLGACVDRPPPVTADDGRPRQPAEDLGAPYGAIVKAGEAAHLAFAGVALDIPAGAVGRDVRVTIRPLPRKHVPRMDDGMTNVTPGGQAFRLGPLGMVFKKPVKLTLPYDRKLMPAGFSAADARTFYYDELTRRWEQVGLLTETDGELVAITEHFTDFVNATIAMPDHPGTQSFNPTSIKDLKLGDPGAGIPMIQPPAPNAQGTAALTFPLEVPPGRRGMQPDLALTYSSDGGNGFVGMGWDLKISSIEIDTRFGVPKYDATDRYLLDGEALTPIPTPAGAPAGGQYYARRVEARFDRIRRLGSAPSNYTWEVVDKEGTTSHYGIGTCDAAPCTTVRDPDPPHNIFRWLLREVRDAFDNRMFIVYSPHVGFLPGGQRFTQMYPVLITYTRNVQAGVAPSYSVEFDNELTGVRQDAFSTARPGFLVATQFRLGSVTVKMGETTIRRYVLAYREGAFGKSLLRSIAMAGLGGTKFLYRYDFDYHAQPDDSGGDTKLYPRKFLPAEIWGKARKVSGGGAALRPEDGLSRTEHELSGSGHMFGAGVSIPGTPIGVSIGFPSGDFGGTDRTRFRLADINGDSLPDLVDDALGVSFGRVAIPSNDPLPDEHFTFAPPSAERDGIRPFALGNTIVSGSNDGFTGSAVVVGAGIGASLTTAGEATALADMNGDGFSDLVSIENGVVKVIPGEAGGAFRQERQRDWGSVAVDGRPLDVPEWSEILHQTTFPVNSLVRWTAPYPGFVRLDGHITKPDRVGDGVVVTISRFTGNKGSAQVTPIWTHDFPAGITFACRPSVGDGCNGDPIDVQVGAGTRLYIMVHGKDDIEGDRIVWSPSFTYTQWFDGFRGAEPWGAPIFRFDQAADFRLAGPPELSWVANATGIVDLTGTIVKETTPDGVLVEMSGNTQAPYFRSLAWNETGPIQINHVMNVVKGNRYTLNVIPDSPVDPDRVRIVNARMTYRQEFCRERGQKPQVCGPLVCTGPGAAGCRVDRDNVVLPQGLVSRRIEPRYRRIAYEPGPVTESFTAVNGPQTISISGNASCVLPIPPGNVFALVQGVNRLYARVPLTGDNIPITLPPLPLAKDEQVFFTIVSHEPLVLPICNWNVVIDGVNRNALVNRRLLLPVPSTFLPPPTGALDGMSGGYHSWSFGDWNGRVTLDAEHEKDIVPPSAVNPDASFMYCAPSSLDVEDVTTMPERRWSCRGVDGHIGPGVMRPSRQLPADGRLFSLRSTQTANDDLSVGLGTGSAFAGYVTGFGRTLTTLELVDMNGDGCADSVTHRDVRFNNCDGGFDLMAPTNFVIRDLSIGSVRAILSGNQDIGRLVHRVSRGAIVVGNLSTKIGLGVDYSTSGMKQDLVDINGDGLPDRVQRDPNTGVTKARLNLGYKFSELEAIWENPSWGVAYEDMGFMGDLRGLPNFDLNMGAEALSLNDTVNTNVSVGDPVGFVAAADTMTTVRTAVQMLDMNGDGLPDQVMKRPGKGDDVRVKLNLGSKFSTPIPWFYPPEWGVDINPGGPLKHPPRYAFANPPDGLSFMRNDGWRGSFDFSLCIFLCVGYSAFTESSTGWTQMDFEDLNGDGLPDHVLKMNGGDLDEPRDDAERILWKENQHQKWNLLKTVTMPLGGTIEIDYERKGNAVATAPAGSVLINAGQPLTVDMPESRWVMSRATVTDGRGGRYSSFFDYNLVPTSPGADPRLPSGNYHRTEKEDLGFSHVRMRRGFPDSTGFVFLEGDGSVVERFYLNHDYYTRRLLTDEYELDAAGALLRGMKITYAAVDVAGTTLAKFPQEQTRLALFYEGRAASGGPATLAAALTSETGVAPKYKRETRKFDAGDGALTELVDEGDEQLAADGVRYEIDYDRRQSPYLVKPKSIKALAVSSGAVLRERRATYLGTGALETLTDVITGGKLPLTGAAYANAPATWRFTYTLAGLVETVTDPNNYVLTYHYDPQTQTYRDGVTDSFGLNSQSTPHLLFGFDMERIDVNRQRQGMEADEFGRITKVWGPLDASVDPPTIRIDYQLQGSTSPLALAPTVPAHAVVSHKDLRWDSPGARLVDVGDPIQTATFIDGLGRVIQTKREMDVDSAGSGTAEHLIVASGQVIFDTRGRVSLQGQPALALSPLTTFETVSTGHPTIFVHDVLDRLVVTVHPDGTLTRALHQVTTPAENALGDGRAYLAATVVDAFGSLSAPPSAPNFGVGRRVTYRDSRGNQAGVKEWNFIGAASALTPLTTRYEYNAVDELTKVTDAKGKATTAVYDTVGRMVELSSLDAGRTEYRYDLAGNLGAKETAVLRPQGRLIKYERELNRLRKIDYPFMPDVTYEYGAPAELGDAFGNRAGRVKKVTMEGESEERFYDRLGNVREARTTLAHMDDPGRPPVTFKMLYTYDSFGRMQEMTFPNWLQNDYTFYQGDGERVVYEYDRGGNLDRITGHHLTPNPSQTSHPRDFTYVSHIGYDRFGQRTVLVSGNGIANKHQYDPVTRRLTDIEADARVDNMPVTPFHRMHYTYDLVGNVTVLENRTSLQPHQNASVNVGPQRLFYGYDNLHQLRSAGGKYRSRTHEGYEWADTFQYDEIGSFKKKSQSLNRLVWDNQNVPPTNDPLAAMAQLDGSRFDHNEALLTYTLDYVYGGTRPHAATTINETLPGTPTPFPRQVSYDANGSNTGNTFRGTTRTQIWDEESRLKEVKIGGTTVVKFRYSDEGERTKKQATTPQLGVNGDSWYVNQFYTLLAGKRPTKHIFAGETRVASKTDAIWMQTPVTHYYHPDHLGTTSYVTDARQALVQHERYFPFGELWRGGGPQEETDLSRPNGDRKEWLFTSKEFDVETGLYYFGARYLDPRIGVWQSTDPILADYMLGAGFGGAYTPSNLGLYTYSRNNPIVLRDPDGRLAPVVVFLIMVAAGSAGSAGGRALDNLISGRPASPGVAAAATGGGVTAALAFTTGGTSLGTQMVGVGLASTIGGGVSRGIETGDAQMTLENMSVDFTLGAGMTLAAGLMTPARPPVRSTISESQVQSVLRSQPEIVASKTAAEMGDDLANAIGRNRVSARTAGGQQIDIDLRGKAHFEKSLGQKVPTPHVRESRVNVGPGGRTSLSDSKVRPATKQDIRTARSIVERR